MFIPINMTCTTKMMFLYCYVDILIMGKILNQLTHTASLSAPKMDIYNLNYSYISVMHEYKYFCKRDIHMYMHIFLPI